MEFQNAINFNDKTGFICDMDGVIYHGNQVLPGVAEFIQWLHDENKEYLFLTNNSGYTPKELNQKLADLKAELFNLRFQHAVNQLDNPLRLNLVKKDIARVLTVLAEKA